MSADDPVFDRVKAVYEAMKESVASTYRAGYASEGDDAVAKWFLRFQTAFGDEEG